MFIFLSFFSSSSILNLFLSLYPFPLYLFFLFSDMLKFISSTWFYFFCIWVNHNNSMHLIYLFSFTCYRFVGLFHGSFFLYDIFLLLPGLFILLIFFLALIVPKCLITIINLINFSSLSSKLFFSPLPLLLVDLGDSWSFILSIALCSTFNRFTMIHCTTSTFADYVPSPLLLHYTMSHLPPFHGSVAPLSLFPGVA